MATWVKSLARLVKARRRVVARLTSMQRTLLPLTLAACGLLGCGGAPPIPRSLVPMPPGSASLRVEVKTPRSPKGTIYCSLHATPKFFPGASPFVGGQLKRSPATTPVICAYDNLRPGTYAVSVFHDENGNGTTDTNWVGAPVEGYGASGGDLPSLGPPTFDGNDLTLAEGERKALEIKLWYR